MTETELKMAQRHVREDEAQVERQAVRIAALRASGPTAAAEDLLRTFEETLAQHRRGLALVLTERKPDTRS